MINSEYIHSARAEKGGRDGGKTKLKENEEKPERIRTTQRLTFYLRAL